MKDIKSNETTSGNLKDRITIYRGDIYSIDGELKRQVFCVDVEGVPDSEQTYSAFKDYKAARQHITEKYGL